MTGSVKEFSVSYALWTAQGEVLYTASLKMAGLPGDRETIIEQISLEARAVIEPQWPQVKTVSYCLLEPIQAGSYARHSLWVDRNPPEEGPEQVATTTATLTLPASAVTVSPQEKEEVLEAVEEILHREQERSAETEGKP